MSNRLLSYDIVICGGGVAGLWLLNVLKNEGYSLLLVEPNAVGGIQTIASQGMIHGGQRYLLGNNSSPHAQSVSSLPARWDACLSGQGEIDLTSVHLLSDTQVMWPAGGSLSYVALNTASYLVRANSRKLPKHEVPEALSASNITVYELPEKVLDVSSLIYALSRPHKDSIRRETVDSLKRDGSLTISGKKVNAQAIICVAGLGNEEFLRMLRAPTQSSQRRPLRQLMVKTMQFPLYGHGITTSYKPRVTITSYPLPTGGYVWYLGGAIAGHALKLTNDEAIAYAKKEMMDIFPSFDWSDKEWGTWYGYRAEPYMRNGRLPDSAVIQEYGSAIVAWPTKLTLVPLLGDKVLSFLARKRIKPMFASPIIFNEVDLVYAELPWDSVEWTV